MATALSRQQERRAQQRARKNDRRKPVSEKTKRLAFKAAKQHFTEIRKATEAQFHLGPVAMQLVMMQLVAMLGAYKSRGKGRGTASRGYGNRSANGPAHQGLQERLRRLIGGWPMHRYDAHLDRFIATSKRQTLARTGYARPDHAAHHLLTGDRLATA
jgi:hypothetical protein